MNYEDLTERETKIMDEHNTSRQSITPSSSIQVQLNIILHGIIDYRSFSTASLHQTPMHR